MIEDALALGPPAGTYLFSRRIAAQHSGEGIVEGSSFSFDPFAYAAGGACAVEPLDDEHLQMTTAWDGRHGAERPANGAFTVAWDGLVLRLYWYSPHEHG